VNLTGIEHTEIHRGMALGPVGIFEPTKRIDARITTLPAHTLKNHARIRIHQGTAETIAEVNLLDRNGIEPGDAAMAQLRLNADTLLLPGDRFILRQLSPAATIGGGVVIDARPQRHRRTDPGVVPFLEKLEQGSYEDILLAFVQSSPRGLSLADILARTGWMEREILAAASNLATLGKLRVVNEDPLVLTSEEIMAKCSASLREAVDAFHKSNPLLPGIPKQDLRGRAGNLRAEVFASGLADLVNSGALTLTGDIVQRAGYAMDLTPDDARAKSLIEQEFERAGLAVPSFAAVIDKLPIEATRARRILQILLREKVLIKVAEDLVFHRSAILRLKEMVSQYRRERGDILPIVAFKGLTGVTRKYAIPLLEYLDREHVTRRTGDERVILEG
jgi:selenocysteine-specific elongation factor